MNVKVLESSCCGTPTKILENVKAAAGTLDVPVEIQHLTDLQQTMQYGITKFPVLVVNEQVVLYGREAEPDEIRTLLLKELKTA